MSITVRDCLSLPALKSGEVMAGEKGLDGIVSSVSVVEFLEMDDIITKYINDYNPNELLISAFYAFKDDVDKQCAALNYLVETGAVALVLFYTGHILKRISPKLVQTANNLSLPLIAIEHDPMKSIRYCDVISDVTEAVFMDKHESRSLISSTINRLSQFSNEHRTMKTLLRVISDYSKCNLILTDHDNIIISSGYWASHNPIDSTKLKGVFASFNSDVDQYKPIKANMNETDYLIYKSILHIKEGLPLHLYIMTYGHTLTEDTISDMTKCVELYSSLWGYSLNIYSKDALIPILLKESTTNSKAFLARMNIAFRKVSGLTIIDAPQHSLVAIENAVKLLFDDYSKTSIVDLLDKYVVVLCDPTLINGDNSPIKSEIDQLAEKYDDTYVFQESDNSTLQSLRDTYMHFCRSADMLKKIFLSRNVWTVHDLNYASEITTLIDTNNTKTTKLVNELKLLSNDSDQLLDTLATYLLDCDSQLNLTAKTMYLHRNTISYRLNQIRQITHTNFTAFPAVNDFSIIATIWRIYGDDALDINNTK